MRWLIKGNAGAGKGGGEEQAQGHARAEGWTRHGGAGRLESISKWQFQAAMKTAGIAQRGHYHRAKVVSHSGRGSYHRDGSWVGGETGNARAAFGRARDLLGDEWGCVRGFGRWSFWNDWSHPSFLIVSDNFKIAPLGGCDLFK